MALGRYSITTAQNALWLKTDMDPPRKTSNRSRRSIEDGPNIEGKSVVYPSLLEGTQYITDPEWKRMIIEAAHGVFPLGFSYRGEEIFYNYGGKRTSVSPSADSYEAVTEVMNFYRLAGGIKTPMDHEYEREILAINREQEEKDFFSHGWPDLKPKAKSRALEDFVAHTVKVHQMTRQDQDLLLTIINLGFINGSIKDSDIIYENGNVQTIKTLIYQPQINQFLLRSDSRFRVKVPSQKGFYQDGVYFDRCRFPVRNSSFKGFGEEWIKFTKNQTRIQTRSVPLTERGTERPTTSSPSIILTPNFNRDDDLSVGEEDDYNYSGMMDWKEEIFLPAVGVAILLSPRFQQFRSNSDTNPSSSRRSKPETSNQETQAPTFPLRDQSPSSLILHIP